MRPFKKTDNTLVSNGQPKKTTLAPYIGYFGIGYVLASAIMMLVQSKIVLNPQLVTALSIFIGAYIAVHKFIKHQKRALSRPESNLLTLGGAGVVWLLSLIYFLALWFWVFDTASRETLIEMATLQPMPLLFAAIIMIVLTLVTARLSIWVLNLLLNPARKYSSP